MESAERDALLARINELSERVASLETEGDGGAGTEGPEEAAPTDRRAFIRTLGAVAAGGAAAIVGGQALPAAATDGGSIVIGNRTQTGTAGTALNYGSTTPTNTGGGLFQVNDNSGIQDLGSFSGAIAGVATGTGVNNGVFGLTVASGGFGGAFSNGGTLGAVERSQLFLKGTAAVPSTFTLAHSAGEICVDSNEDLWYCSTSGTPGSWTRLGGTSTAGALALLPTPVRVYDSRPIGTDSAATGDGPLSGGNTRVVQVHDGFVNTTATPAAPAGCRGCLFTLTIVNTSGGGFLSVYPNGGTQPTTSTINWTGGGQVVATTSVSGVDSSARIKVLAGGSASTDFIVDIIGYYW